jgi:hypothetical protein
VHERSEPEGEREEDDVRDERKHWHG